MFSSPFGDIAIDEGSSILRQTVLVKSNSLVQKFNRHFTGITRLTTVSSSPQIQRLSNLRGNLDRLPILPFNHQSPRPSEVLVPPFVLLFLLFLFLFKTLVLIITITIFVFFFFSFVGNGGVEFDINREALGGKKERDQKGIEQGEAIAKITRNEKVK